MKPHAPISIAMLTASVLLPVVSAPPARGDDWKADVSQAAFPNHPVSGRIHGASFKPTSVEVEVATGKKGDTRTDYYLHLQEGKDFFPNQKCSISLITHPGEKLDGKSYHLGAGGALEMPGAIKDGVVSYPPIQGVQLSWMRPGGRPEMDLNSRYTLRLEFGHAANGKLPGKIYVSFQDAQKSFLAGTFIAKLTAIRSL